MRCHYRPGLIILFLVSAAVGTASAAFLRDFPVTVRQPDGTSIKCFVTGDEYFHLAADVNGFTVVIDPETGYYVYARLGPGGDLEPTRLVVGRDDPETAGLTPGIAPPPGKVREIVRAASAPYEKSSSSFMAPSEGSINGVVILIRFSGEADFTTSSDLMTNLFNNQTPGSYSLRNYYSEVSYGHLTVTASIFPTPGTVLASYQDSHPRSYYQKSSTSNPGGYTDSSDKKNREDTLLRNAVNAVSSQIPPGLNVDQDGDSMVDSIAFIIKGQPDAWNDLLWPHSWTLTTYVVRINGKQVRSYTFHLESVLTQSEASGVSVLGHEMFHNIGAPDLYHYTDNGFWPVGVWDIMERDNAQHMSAYMKYTYGRWITSLPVISSSGWYTLHPLTSPDQNCFRINSPYTTDEYFVVEYRRQEGIFESRLPGSGLVVYRVNQLMYRLGNRNGPPDELYVCRPYGSLQCDGLNRQAFLSSDAGRAQVRDFAMVSPLLSDGGTSGIEIVAVGSVGDTISFYVRIPGCNPPGLAFLPVNQTVQPGQAATLSVAIVGNGPFTYQWFEGRRNDRSKPTVGTGAAFTTPPLASTTLYWVEVTNSCGSIQTGEIAAAVAKPLPGGGRYRAAGAVVNKDSLYVIGGWGNSGASNLVERYDMGSGAWTGGLAPLPVPLRNMQAAVVDGVIYLPGGYDGTQFVKIIQAYDTASNTWFTGLADPPIAFSSTVVACNGKVYCFGGDRQGGSGSVKEAWCYDPAANTWSTDLAPLPTALSYGSAVAVNNFCYVAGGTNSSGFQTSLMRYDTLRDRWETGPNLIMGRMNPVMVWLGKYLYAFEGGGSTGNSWWPINAVERYRLTQWPNGSWEVVPYLFMPQGVVATAGGCLSDGRVYLAGGAVNPTRDTTDLLQTFTEAGLPCSSCLTLTPDLLTGQLADNSGLGCGDVCADFNSDGAANAVDLVELLRRLGS